MTELTISRQTLRDVLKKQYHVSCSFKAFGVCKRCLACFNYKYILGYEAVINRLSIWNYEEIHIEWSWACNTFVLLPHKAFVIHSGHTWWRQCFFLLVCFQPNFNHGPPLVSSCTFRSLKHERHNYGRCASAATNELNPMCAGKSLCNVMLLIEERKQAHLPATYVIQSHYIFPVLFLLCGLGESAT